MSETAPRALQPTRPPVARSASSALLALLDARHSCRAFRPDAVPQETIERVLHAAQRSPSWCNTQPWHVIVTLGTQTSRFRDAYIRAALAGAPNPDFPFPTAYAGVYDERRRDCGRRLYQSVGIARDDRDAAHRQSLRNYELFGAPHVAIITTEAQLGVYGLVDCGAYIANFLNAATAEGLGCIAQAALASYPDLVRQHFELPTSRHIVCGISFGYADCAHPVNNFRTPRAKLTEAVSFVD